MFAFFEQHNFFAAARSWASGNASLQHALSAGRFHAGEFHAREFGAGAAHGHNARGGAIDVDVDLSVFVQVGLFVVLLLVLKPLLFEPMLKLFEEREKRIEGAAAEARRMDNESAEAQNTYETAMNTERAKANADRDKLRAEGTKAEGEILATARDQVAKVVLEGRAALAAEAAAARATLGNQTADLGRELASRLLGREIQ